MQARMLFGILFTFVFVGSSLGDKRRPLKHDFSNENGNNGECPPGALVVCREIIHGETAWANITNCICPQSTLCIQNKVIVDVHNIARDILFKCTNVGAIFRQIDANNRGESPTPDQYILAPDGTVVTPTGLVVYPNGGSKQGRRGPEGITYYKNNNSILVPGIANLWKIIDVLGPDWRPIQHGPIINEKIALGDRGTIDLVQKVVSYPNMTRITIVQAGNARPNDFHSAVLHRNGTLILPGCTTFGVHCGLPQCNANDFCKDNIYSTNSRQLSADYFMCFCPPQLRCEQKEGPAIQYVHVPQYPNLTVQRQPYVCSANLGGIEDNYRRPYEQGQPYDQGSGLGGQQPGNSYPQIGQPQNGNFPSNNQIPGNGQSGQGQPFNPGNSYPQGGQPINGNIPPNNQIQGSLPVFAPGQSGQGQAPNTHPHGQVPSHNKGRKHDPPKASRTQDPHSKVKHVSPPHGQGNNNKHQTIQDTTAKTATTPPILKP